MPKLRHANTMATHGDKMDTTGGEPPCVVHSKSMCWHSVGMPQLGHLLARPSVLNISYNLLIFHKYIISRSGCNNLSAWKQPGGPIITYDFYTMSKPLCGRNQKYSPHTYFKELWILIKSIEPIQGWYIRIFWNIVITSFIDFLNPAALWARSRLESFKPIYN